ncbi:hypothetical protein MF672_046985 [Actinomadura sp. ATCC 31491]|uniref:Uncharacterized protein n=1 Tax=Actinomadura luzonensis TaxID=2805427 RepID=A0ABT0G9N6_9ACTN|nr:hypothetical protein [Actinomadura luzonensis]MCK2221301.1 hypothetical protein [Actinomadura luzonensis]
MTVTSACPHTPTCPPPVCLPPSLRPAASPSSAPKPVKQDPGSDRSNLPGYESRTGSIDAFAGVMTDSARGVHLVKQRTPRFEGWNLAPLAGVPVVGLMFTDRFNRIADTWSDSARILGDVLHRDAGKVTLSAGNYRAAEQANGKN